MFPEQLPVFEDTKRIMDFDPDAAPPVIEHLPCWDLDEHYPPRLGELIVDLTSKLGLGPDQMLALDWLARCDGSPDFIERVAEVMAEHSGEEASNDGEVSQDPEADGHVKPGAGVAASEGNA